MIAAGGSSGGNKQENTTTPTVVVPKEDSATTKKEQQQSSSTSESSSTPHQMDKKFNNNNNKNIEDSDSDLSSGSDNKDPTTRFNILRSTSLRKAYKNLKQQEREEFDLVQSDASQSESENYIPSNKNKASSSTYGVSLLKTPKIPSTVATPTTKHHHHHQSETVSQTNRLVCITRPSILARDADKLNSYRGFLNLAIIILVVSHLRLMLINFNKYGILLNTHEYVVGFLKDPSNGWEVMFMFLSLTIWIVLAFAVEKVIAIYIRKKFSQLLTKKDHQVSKRKTLWAHILKNASFFSFCCYFVLDTTLLGATISFVWLFNPHPVASMILLSLGTIIFLKLTSYGVVNDHLRERMWERKVQKLKTIDNAGSGSGSNSGNTGISWYKQYPDNISLYDIFYFMFAPTLVYEECFPRTKAFRFKVLLLDCLELLACSFILIFLVEQYVMPLVEHSVEPMREKDLLRLFERLLKLTVPNIVIWIVGFYIIFHLALNITGELLCFGDRLFYLDWWNCTDLSYFWRTWNLPVHKWMVLHIYLPLVNNGVSASIASFCVFFVSAIFHELIISVPFHKVYGLAFLAMMVQMPLCFVTKKYLRGKQIGNVVFWMSFMIGHSNTLIFIYNDMHSKQTAATQ